MFSCITHAENGQSIRPLPIYHNFLNNYIQDTSIQFSLFSYKPTLGDLNNLLQSVGIQKTPVELMPTVSLVVQHIPQIDSRLEIGYWKTELSTPTPNSMILKTSLLPISYQIIYKPVLLHEYLPVYFGGGIGFINAKFSGSLTEFLEEQGISVGSSASNTIGYVFIGAELFEWKSKSGSDTSFGNNASINIELRRILKKIETTGPQPLNIVLDGTAIGLGVRTQF